MALADPAKKGKAPSGSSSGPSGMEVALLGALVDAIMDPGGASVACPYLCKLFQGAEIHWLADSKESDDIGVSDLPTKSADQKFRVLDEAFALSRLCKCMRLRSGLRSVRHLIMNCGEKTSTRVSGSNQVGPFFKPLTAYLHEIRKVR